ncbi:uncharacterized protein K452DRAFT_357365 [Aplosporella prunicola CBS 121167]|uniref:Uncharacterized protein n=1 Tax=Aplosporella prunicola CBS 121167 TaxID=1176127 RepID=A0A6A6BHY2_9PEZI|nr:uncharacterized protein K452DRAFT_357365 [Aplosporella prunicola CBS 121167]KAF2143740.1 hypothetical protein K452DRAFT_357365 [Aplosporella prunicola CBS 121167]
MVTGPGNTKVTAFKYHFSNRGRLTKRSPLSGYSAHEVGIDPHIWRYVQGEEQAARKQSVSGPPASARQCDSISSGLFTLPDLDDDDDDDDDDDPEEPQHKYDDEDESDRDYVYSEASGVDEPPPKRKKTAAQSDRTQLRAIKEELAAVRKRKDEYKERCKQLEDACERKCQLATDQADRIDTLKETCSRLKLERRQLRTENTRLRNDHEALQQQTGDQGQLAEDLHRMTQSFDFAKGRYAELHYFATNAGVNVPDYMLTAYPPWSN